MTPNSIAFTALCNEYCHSLETCLSTSPRIFIHTMLRLLPRIYISASYIQSESLNDGVLDARLEEDMYNIVRSNISTLLGKYDTFLEVFEEDMKYSDTPIGSSLSENLADLYQVFYNYIETVKDVPEEISEEALYAVKEEFCNYWGQTLCNIMRPLNNIYYNTTDLDEGL